MSEQPQVNTAGNTDSEQQAVSSVTVENAAAVAALLLLEKQAIDAVSGPLRQLLRNIFRMLAARYVLMFGGLEQPAADAVQAQQLAELLVTELQAVAEYDPTPQLQQFAAQAAARGLEYANRYLTAPVAPGVVQLEPVLTEAIGAVPETMAESVASTANFVEQLPITGWDDLVRAMGKANQAATSLERSTTWAVNKANSDAIRQVAVNKGASLLWVAEPDACVICLALSGHIIDPMSGDGFDEEATFGKPGSAPDVWPPGEPLMGPPRHVSCRCHPELWFGAHAAPGGPEENSLYNRPGVGANVDLPAALRREAKRSIVYGWSLPSESGAVRLDAASRLLARGAGLPRSVEERGHRAVAKGAFDNRIHPSHRRRAVRR
ncbi:MAG TPA: hypothetical protein VGS97_20350 [Actinocrinis sp.]|uniref:hypothetical protein n=1 Tax=Actinocrinis sp. TaxID=1920516 RepID=UPI002DDCEE1B|nr:hypothetical protein [Actinocrinis sp.]HEV2346462.1 hypothetical protein [Actinocrinis sp.]